MRQFATVCLFIASTLGASAQVQNGGFETSSALPSNTGEWALVDGWDNAGSAIASPDYFHNNGSLGGDLPETPIAMINAYEGDAIMGFIATGTKGTQYREYISTELGAALIPGEKYVVSFQISNGYLTDFSNAGLGTSHMGVAFTTSAPAQNGNQPLMLTPQFRRQTALYDREWQEFTFSFIADAAHTNMTIGVFGDDADKTIEYFDGNNAQFAYYFVDKVSIDIVNPEIQEESGGKDDSEPDPVVIIDDEIKPSFFIPNAFTPNGDGDNDIFAPVVPDNMQDYRFCIYNRWGELVFETSVTGMGWGGNSMSGGPVSSDMYVWELSFTRITEDGEKHEERHQGTVNLLR
ncbi:MAG: gliding motility-associated C-terminal domain-containing protein [Flavobacteriales bacterium]|nr:gliding motility-associated C-terminal domain-containing protein [Flavobacteriales bacterium]